MKGKVVKEPIEGFLALARGSEFVAEDFTRDPFIQGWRITVRPGEFNDAVAKLPGFIGVTPREHLGYYLGIRNPPKAYLVEDVTLDQVLEKLRSTGYKFEFEK